MISYNKIASCRIVKVKLHSVTVNSSKKLPKSQMGYAGKNLMDPGTAIC